MPELGGLLGLPRAGKEEDERQKRDESSHVDWSRDMIAARSAPTNARATKNAKIAARQSGSRQPPKSSAVAATPAPIAASNAVTSSVFHRICVENGTILATRNAAMPEMTHEATPMR